MEEYARESGESLPHGARRVVRIVQGDERYPAGDRRHH